MFLALAAATSGCASLPARPRPPSPADSTLAKAVLGVTLTEYWRDALTREGDAALANGLRAATLPDISQEGRKEDFKVAQRIGIALDAVNVSALSEADYVTLLALRWAVDQRAEATAFYLPDFSFLSPATSPIRELNEVYRLHPIDSPNDAERYLYFAEALPFVLERIRAGVEERAQRGYVAPRETVESAIAFYRTLRDLGDDGPWRLDTTRTRALDVAQRYAFEKELQQIVKLRIQPSLDSLVNYLDRSYLYLASARPGLWQYPGGKELYRHLLRRNTSLDVAPDEAHRVGLGELRRIDSTMFAFRRRQHWNPNPVAFNDSLRRATPRAPSIEAVIAAMEAREKALATHLATQFAHLPASRPVIRAATPAEAAFWPDGTYLPPKGLDSLGVLLLTDRWREPAATIPQAARTFRFLLPGRALAGATIYGDSLIPPVRRQMVTPGFSDGWSQYAASLAGEMGMYSEPLDAYGRLLDQGAAMALLVVDTGIHYLGWTLAQGREVLGRYVLASDEEIDRMLIERVINDPGRAGAGALGGREFAAMRAWMQRDLGGAFEAPRWHAEMLSLGAIPLPMMGTHLEWWLYDLGRRAAEARAKAAADAAAKAPKPAKLKKPG